MTEELEKYILQHIDAEPEHLRQLDRDTHVRLLYARMCSGHLQGRMLKMLVRMINPRLVLELGTYSGYATQCLAEGLLHDEAHVHTIEIEDELEDFISQHLAQSPVRDRITLHIGDAVDILRQLNQQFDLIYIDANKRDYTTYYDLAMVHLRPGGYIIADNTLWDGKVTDPACHDAQTRGIRAFNDRVASDPRVERVILPLRDGLTIIRYSG
ncbi:MAG: O-methyltransferase [Muribaculaceae bacterium]|nr:O-methyltransferase [Muribaculaceae bacterium]